MISRINPIGWFLTKLVMPLQLNFWEIAAPIVGGLIGASGAKSAAKTSAAASDRAAQLAYEQSLPWGMAGLFGSATFDEDGKLGQVTLAPELQEHYDRLLARGVATGETLAGFAGDPFELQQQIYEQQRELFAPQQEEERLALENRLLAQGMLGATGGQQRMGALLESQQMQDLARQGQALTQAQQLVDLYRGREAEDIGLATELGKLPLDYASIGRGIGGGLSNVAGIGAGIRSTAAAGLGGAQAAFWDQIGQGVTTGLQNIGGLFGSSGGTFTSTAPNWNTATPSPTWGSTTQYNPLF